jgi:hypothetical protein
MRVTILAIVVACVLFASASLLIIRPASQEAAVAGSTIDARTSSILFDTSRILALLQSLILARHQQPVTVPSSSKMSAPVATSTVGLGTASTTPKNTPKLLSKAKDTLPAIITLSPLEIRLGLALPSLRSALVNIICLPTSSGSSLRGVSGSGVIIDPRGVILTAAHVAQYELLAQEHPDLVQCVIRTGSPATNAYTAAPLYVSSAWIQHNKDVISSSAPTGTGQDDYALLGITGSANGLTLPSSFPYILLAHGDPALGQPAVIGSYGAEFLTSARIRSSLFPSFEYSTVQDRRTFVSDTIDVISVGGGSTAQEGSSGGGVVDDTGHLMGLITTSTTGSNIQTRDLRSITSSYLERTFATETGKTVEDYLSTNSPSALITSYQTQAAVLAAILIRANHLGN